MRVFVLTRKRLAALSAAVAVVVGITAMGAHRSQLAVAVNANGRSIPVYSVKTDEKRVSLSFDAAWGNEYTQPLLDILKKHNVKTTFFLVGDWVRSYPDDVKKIAAEGHDVGNHSDTHPYMTQLDGDTIKKEIDACNDEIEKLTGKKPTLFRPPYGDYDNKVVDTVNGSGMHCVQWSIDSLDWQDPSPDEILQRVKDNLAPGAIILMHNGAKNTPEALPSVIEYIQSQGYEIVPISQLLPNGRYNTDANGVLIPDSDTAVKTAAQVEYKRGTDTDNSGVFADTDSSGISAPVTSSKTSSQMSSSATSSKYTGLAGELYNSGEKKK